MTNSGTEAVLGVPSHPPQHVAFLGIDQLTCAGLPAGKDSRGKPESLTLLIRYRDEAGINQITGALVKASGAADAHDLFQRLLTGQPEAVQHGWFSLQVHRALRWDIHIDPIVIDAKRDPDRARVELEVLVPSPPESYARPRAA